MGYTPSIEEQETVIRINRDEEKAHIFTSDRTVKTRLDKLVNDPETDWTLVCEDTIQGTATGWSYEAPKRCISFRSKITERKMTEEQRQAAAERLRLSRTAKNA